MKVSVRSSQSGFTLLEMMLVIAIIALLVGGAIKLLGPQLGIAQNARIDGDVAGISTALMTYRSLNGSYPTTAQGLKALVERPNTDPRPVRWQQVMSQVPQDPWFTDYIYVCPGRHNPNGYDISSAGPDKQPNTADDIPGNWQSGA